MKRYDIIRIKVIHVASINENIWRQHVYDTRISLSLSIVIARRKI